MPADLGGAPCPQGLEASLLAAKRASQQQGMICAQLAKPSLLRSEERVDPVVAQPFEGAPDALNLTEINTNPEDHLVYQRARNDKPMTRKSMAQTMQVADAPSDLIPKRSSDMEPLVATIHHSVNVFASISD